MLPAGTVLGQRYEIKELIGQGGMSLVYRAADRIMKRDVAIKMLREQYSNDPDFIRRFKREGQSVAALSHINIVKVYDVCQEGNTFYLVMELIDGDDLKEVLARQEEPMSTHELYAVYSQICDGIAYAHHQKIIHRDIKPQNIILEADGTIKVTDFGIARAASETTATMTHTGSLLGTVHYLAPEQAKGEIADQRSDIYALGVLLYEMACGVLPFEGESAISVAVQKIQEDPVRPREVNPYISESIEKVILKAMDRNPDNRYQTALQLKEDIREACFNNRVIYADMDKKEEDLQNTATADLSLVKEKLKQKSLPDDYNEMKEKKAAREAAIERKKNGNPGLGSTKKKRTNPIKVIAICIVAAAFIVGGLFLGMKFSELFNTNTIDVDVPDVYGMTLEEATKTLNDFDLIIEINQNKITSSVGADCVAYQEPAAGVPVKNKSIVTVTLGKGIEQVMMPDLSNMTLREASVQLANYGLVLDSVYDTDSSDSIAADYIMGQSVAPNTQINTGETIRVTLSTGAAIISCPDFMNENIYTILLERESEGYNIEYEYDMSWNVDADCVMKQSPLAGTGIRKSETIYLTVSYGPGPSNVMSNQYYEDEGLENTNEETTNVPG